MLKLSTLKSSLIFTVTGTFPLLSGFVLLPFYTQTLSLENFGLLAIYMALSLGFQIIIGWGLDTTLGVHFLGYSDKPAQQGTIFWGSTGFMFMSTILLGVACMVLAQVGELKFGDTVFTQSYLLIVLSTALGSAIFKLISQWLIVTRKSTAYLALNSLNLTGVVIFSLSLLHFWGNSLGAPLWGRNIGVWLCTSIAMLFAWKHIAPAWNYHTFKTVFNYSLPNVLFNIINWASNYLDRFLLLALLNAGLVGIFDISIKMALVIELTLAGLFNAFYPRILELWNPKDSMLSAKEINKVFHVLTAAALLLIALNLLLVPWLIPYLIPNKDYTLAFQLLPYACLSYSFDVLATNNILPLYLMRKNQYIPVVSAIGAVIKLLMAYFLVIEFGIYGAVASLFFRKSVESVLYYVVASRFYRFTFNPIKMVVTPMLFLCVSFFILFWADYIGPFTTHFIVLIAAILLCGINYHSEIATIIKNKGRGVINVKG